MAERDSLRVIPLLFLTAFLAPYLILLARYGITFAVDEYTLWVFLFTLAQALASAVFSVAAGLALLPIYVRLPALKPVVMVPFFAPALSTVDALIRMLGDVMYSPWGIVIAHVVYYAPYAALLMESNLRSIPADILDAAEIYARRISTRARVIFTELKPSLAYSFYTIFVFSFLTFTTPLLLGGRYPTLELLVYLYATSFASTQLVSTVVLITLLSSLALALPFFKLPTLPPAEPSPRAPRLGLFAVLPSLPLALFYLALAAYLVLPAASPRGLEGAWTPLANSLLVALASSAISLALAVSFLFSDVVGSRLPAVSYVAAISLSKSLFAIGFFHLAQPLYGTLLILLVAHVFVITPLVYSIVKPAFEKIRQDAREACLLYLGPVRCVARILSEALGPTIVQAWLVALASSISETTLAFILTTGAASTLSAEAARLLTSRAPDLIETGHFYSSLMAVMVLATLALSRLVKTKPYAF